MKVMILGCGRAGSILAQLLRATVTTSRYRLQRRRSAGLDSKVHQVVRTGIDVAARQGGHRTGGCVYAVTNGDNTNIMYPDRHREFNVPVLARYTTPAALRRIARLASTPSARPCWPRAC